ncbi:MAG TPA: hypothetical protein VMU75_12730 [Acidimicrobiales bacterium]|nr:hypothetical protein [Acidimicrobiales bacterium]
MTRNTRPPARAETVGSLLQPERLLHARKRLAEGELRPEELSRIEDEAVLDAIALQESVGLDVITDGEMRRTSWAATTRFLSGIAPRPGLRSYPASAAQAGDDPVFPTVVERIAPLPGVHLGEEYAFLRDHSDAPTKYTMAAPSYHRRYWSDEVSRGAYDACEEFLIDVRDWLRVVARELIEQGCGYIQLDAPNYGSLCDPQTRRFHVERGHDIEAEIAFDADLDSSVFEGLDVTSALHVCRGNQQGGSWHSRGGYLVIADVLFSHLDVDAVLLEYDSDRAGDFGPLAAVPPGTVAVLGLLTTKAAGLEDESDLHKRIEEAARIRPLADLALSTQCGFASAANAPMTAEEQRAKLALVASVAHKVWEA